MQLMIRASCWVARRDESFRLCVTEISKKPLVMCSVCRAAGAQAGLDSLGDHTHDCCRLPDQACAARACRGRKKAALTYVATYTLGCLTKHWNMFGVLLVGRLFCGVATSLLYSAFESWLVAEHFKVRARARPMHAPLLSDALPLCPALCNMCRYGLQLL